uniref:Chorismate-utilising enzyme C-terminal domain-containing protein n=1 Tax=Norrisiella sphaerica TaxID=552664 RepID=A0A7S2QT27_9EUKA
MEFRRVQTNEEESAKTEGSLEPNTGRELNGLVDTGGRASLKSREGNIARCGTPWTKNSNAKRERADHKGKVQRARRNDEICGNISVSIFSEKAEKTRAESYDKYSPQPLSPSLFEMNSERWVAYVNSVLRQCQGSTDATQFEEKENPLQMKQENYSTKTQITSSQASTLPESSVKRDHKLLEKSGEAAHSPTMPETSRWGMNTYLGDVRWGEKAYKERIRRCQELIQDGESYELCLTNQMLLSDKSMELVKDPLDFYLSLRRTNPAPYGAFFSFRGKYFGEGHQNGVWNRKGCSVSHESQSPSCLGLSRGERKNGDGKSESREFCILSCSPERFLRITKAGEVESKPIKGTRPRGRNEKEDREIIQELKNSEKDFAENLMIVDLTRNDLGRVCVPGSISVPKLMHVETYATVHQLVSTIRGELGGQSTPLDALKAAFPPGSMTGAPKKRSTELLDVIEGGRRGIYSGCIGFIGFGGAVDLNVVIRTVVWSPERMTLGTGGAIIHVSDVEEEHIEMILKTRGIFMALRNFENEQKKSSLLGN